MPSWLRKNNLPVKIRIPKLEETILNGTRRDALLENFITLNVPTSQNLPGGFDLSRRQKNATFSKTYIQL